MRVAIGSHAKGTPNGMLVESAMLNIVVPAPMQFRTVNIWELDQNNISLDALAPTQSALGSSNPLQQNTGSTGAVFAQGS